jgi:hypothetical protein
MTETAGRELVSRTIADAIAAHETVRRGSVQPVVDAAAIIDTLCRGGKVLLFGNGGSAADAQHVAAELVGRFERVRRPFAAIALSADTSVLTAIANDEGYERVFTRQIEALGREGDVVIRHYDERTLAEHRERARGGETARLPDDWRHRAGWRQGCRAGRHSRERAVRFDRARAGSPEDAPACNV